MFQNIYASTRKYGTEDLVRGIALFLSRISGGKKPPTMQRYVKQYFGVSNKPPGQRQDTGPGILWSNTC